LRRLAPERGGWTKEKIDDAVNRRFPETSGWITPCRRFESLYFAISPVHSFRAGDPWPYIALGALAFTGLRPMCSSNKSDGPARRRQDRVSFHESAPGIQELAVEDNGLGLPEGSLNRQNGKSLGLRIVEILTSK